MSVIERRIRVNLIYSLNVLGSDQVGDKLIFAIRENWLLITFLVLGARTVDNNLKLLQIKYNKVIYACIL